MFSTTSPLAASFSFAFLSLSSLLLTLLILIGFLVLKPLLSKKALVRSFISLDSSTPLPLASMRFKYPSTSNPRLRLSSLSRSSRPRSRSPRPRSPRPSRPRSPRPRSPRPRSSPPRPSRHRSRLSPRRSPSWANENESAEAEIKNANPKTSDWVRRGANFERFMIKN